MAQEQSIRGKAALELLAARFPLLYVAPAEDAETAYKLAATRGIAPEQANLDHFLTTPEDELRVCETPAGPVEVLYLKNRADFECFLKIVSHRAQPVDIAPTIGAITYRGLADWQAVAQAHAAYLEQGGTDWAGEFRRLASEGGGFRAQLVLISCGPYSNIRADKTPYDESAWLDISKEIRLHHECAHVVCRTLMPEDILPVWDEVTADVVGLLGATGSYDAGLAALFLGVGEQGYAGGRLEEYLDEAQRERIDNIAKEVFAALCALQERTSQNDAEHPFDYVLELKRNPLLSY